MKLIDKDALVAEIENLKNTYKKCQTRNSYEDGLKNGRLFGYKDALHKINTLEVKEVDLEEEARKWQDKVYLKSGYQDSFGTPHAPFHEIGDAFIAGAKFMIKAQKGE